MEVSLATTKPDISMSLNGKLKLTFEVDKAKLDAIQGLPDKVLDMTIKDHREKRSLDANAYCWSLITKIADNMRASKDEVYLQALKDYGQSEMISVQSHIDISGFVKYFEPIGQGKVNGKEFTHYKVYKGSSEYDTKEMSVFIDGIVSDAKGLGIDTRTPQEIAEMMSLWEQRQ